MERCIKKPQKSFTLIELLIYVAVLAIIISAVFAFLNWAMKINAKTKAMREALDNVRFAMDIMTYETREAKSIYLPTSTSTQLSLKTNHNLPDGETSTFVDFYLCGAAKTVLCLKRESESPLALTSEEVEVNNLEFLQIGTTTPAVQISLGINFKNPQQKPEYQAIINVTSTASLRSY